MQQTNIPPCFSLLAATALLLLFGSEARATLSISGPCGTLMDINPLDLIPGCTLADGTTIGSQGGIGDASRTSFELHISPAFMSVPNGVNHLPESFFTYFTGAPTTFSASYVRIDGIVNLFSPASVITLDLIGFADPVPVASATETFTAAGCTRFPCGFPVFAEGFGAGHTNTLLFTEQLIVDIRAGGGSYSVAGSPVFEATPEPASLILFATGLLALAWIHRCKTA
jgi:PEP-CTERM motif